VVTPIELKAVETLPVRAATRVLGEDGLDVEQRNWHLDWQRHGGQSLVVLGTGIGARCKHYAVSGQHADALNDWSVAQWVAHSMVPVQLQGPAFWNGFVRLLGKRI